MRTQSVGAKGPGWKVRYNELTEANAKLKGDRENLEKALNAEKTAKIQALAKAENEIARLNQENTQAAQQLKAKEEELTTSNNALHVATDNERALTDENGKLRNEIAASQKVADENVKKAIDLQDQLTQAKGTLDLLKERNDQLVMDVSKARMKLKGFGATLEGPADASQIPVFGKVTAVSPSKVELSIGTDDGVRIGQELDIYRGDKYVGRIRVIEAKPENAVASILTDYQQYPIQRGDNVDSQLRSTMKTAVKRAG